MSREHTPCWPCSHYERAPIYFLNGKPIYNDRCQISRSAFPSIGPMCSGYDCQSRHEHCRDEATEA